MTFLAYFDNLVQVSLNRLGNLLDLSDLTAEIEKTVKARDGYYAALGQAVQI